MFSEYFSIILKKNTCVDTLIIQFKGINSHLLERNRIYSLCWALDVLSRKSESKKAGDVFDLLNVILFNRNHDTGLSDEQKKKIYCIRTQEYSTCCEALRRGFRSFCENSYHFLKLIVSENFSRKIYIHTHMNTNNNRPINRRRRMYSSRYQGELQLNSNPNSKHSVVRCPLPVFCS